jgi:hypothetical protein
VVTGVRTLFVLTLRHSGSAQATTGNLSQKEKIKIEPSTLAGWMMYIPIQLKKEPSTSALVSLESK